MRPERIVHLGLGAFFRAHLAWYTQHASDSEAWGIVAYTGRSPLQAELIKRRDCVYTLVTRGPESDQFEQIEVIVRAESGSNTDDLVKTIAAAETAIVTLTITEAGYLIEDGSQDSILNSLLLGLDARRQSNGRPLALVSCDNLPNNGVVLKHALIRLAADQNELLVYLNTLSFVTTSIDRITPKTTPLDINQAAQELGFEDYGLVVTEPFADWVLSGDFPMGRPRWESAGAKFVSELEPFENRKLWLLNGSHSLMAYLGLLRGHESVAQAIADKDIYETVENWWDEAATNLDDGLLQLDSYRNRLLERYKNKNIRHLLTQIAKDGSSKLAVRIVPVIKLERRASRMPIGAVSAIAAWIAYCMKGLAEQDPKLELIQELVQRKSPPLEFLNLLDPELVGDKELLAVVEQRLSEITQK